MLQTLFVSVTSRRGIHAQRQEEYRHSQQLLLLTFVYTHSQYVILNVFPWQQRLCERASILRYTYTACLV